MQESLGNTETKSNISPKDSYSQRDEIDPQNDTDADAFAILSLLLVITFTVVYYLNP